MFDSSLNPTQMLPLFFQEDWSHFSEHEKQENVQKIEHQVQDPDLDNLSQHDVQKPPIAIQLMWKKVKQESATSDRWSKEEKTIITHFLDEWFKSYPSLLSKGWSECQMWLPQKHLKKHIESIQTFDEAWGTLLDVLNHAYGFEEDHHITARLVVWYEHVQKKGWAIPPDMGHAMIWHVFEKHLHRDHRLTWKIPKNQGDGLARLEKTDVSTEQYVDKLFDVYGKFESKWKELMKSWSVWLTRPEDQKWLDEWNEAFNKQFATMKTLGKDKQAKRDHWAAWRQRVWSELHDLYENRLGQFSSPSAPPKVKSRL